MSVRFFPERLVSMKSPRRANLLVYSNPLGWWWGLLSLVSAANIGAWVFVVARLLYVPAYAFGPPGVRPLCWLAAQVGIFVIVTDLFV